MRVLLRILGWTAARRSVSEAAILQIVKTFGVLQIQYYNTHARCFGTFDQMVDEHILRREIFDKVSGAGYVLTLGLGRALASFALNADPSRPRFGTKHFYIDSTNSNIHVHATRAAGPTDPVLMES